MQMSDIFIKGFLVLFYCWLLCLIGCGCNKLMHETLNFLTIIDDKLKRSEGRRLSSISVREKAMSKFSRRYPYAKAIDFSESKYADYPRWLT